MPGAYTAYLSTQLAIGVVLGGGLLGLSRFLRAEHRDSRFPAASRMFETWWALLGAAWWAWAIDTLIAASGATGSVAALVDYALIATYFALILLAFASLFHFLLFLYAGSRRLAWIVWTLYGGIAFALTILLLVANPPTRFAVTGLYGETLWGEYSGFANVLRVLLLLPVTLAALGLFFVVPRIPEARQKYRVLMLAASLALYLLMPLAFGSNPGVEPATGSQWVREVLNKAGLLAAIIAAFVAYRPPAWVQRRLESPGGRSRPADDARETALLRRVRDLV